MTRFRIADRSVRHALGRADGAGGRFAAAADLWKNVVDPAGRICSNGGRNPGVRPLRAAGIRGFERDVTGVGFARRLGVVAMPSGPVRPAVVAGAAGG